MNYIKSVAACTAATLYDGHNWGASHGFAGHLIMTDEWFNEYMFRVVVHKKYLAFSTFA